MVWKHLLWPIILGLDLSHNYMIGIHWFPPRQLHLHQGPWSIVVSHPTPFLLHINQISTLPPPHLLVKTISQVTVPSRTLTIVPDTVTGNPKPKCNYSLIGTQFSLEQNLFIVPLLKIFNAKLTVHLCTVINFSPDDVILPKNWHIGEMTPLSHTNNSVHHINKVTHEINPTPSALVGNSKTLTPTPHVKLVMTHNPKLKHPY